VSHDRALLDAVAERTLAIEGQRLNSYEGGWAEYVRRREETRVEPQPRKEAKARKAAPRQRTKPSELERIEAEIVERESAVSELERRLAEDWNDLETLAAHRAARDELQALLQRWETLFERAQS
jgi:ATPase subunit of ABC transporter with duplicated ATPase domains